jgi:broad specificity phosphatase PhoE
MNLPRHFYFVRHGETFLNFKKKISGQTNTRLTEKGKSDILRLKKKIKNIKINYIYTSSLLRTRETSKILFGNKNKIKKISLRKFDERNWGVLEKKSISNIKNFKIKPRNGESFDQFERRIIDLISFRKFEEKSFFCLHKGVLKVFLKFMGISAQKKILANSKLIEFKKTKKKYNLKVF